MQFLQKIFVVNEDLQIQKKNNGLLKMNEIYDILPWKDENPL